MERLRQHRAFKGEQHFYRHRSDVFQMDMQLAVYVPVAALKGKAYGQLYFLPELGQSLEEAVSQSHYQNLANRYDTMVIIPEMYSCGGGDRRALLRLFLQQRGLRSAYLHSELPARLGELFPSEQRPAIMGFGLGGSLALCSACQYPDAFRSASAFAPWLGFSQTEFYSQVASRADLESIDPLAVLPQNKNHPPLWIDQGDADDWQQEIRLPQWLSFWTNLPSSQPIQAQLRKRYDHSYFFLQSFMREHLVFHAEQH